MPLTRLGSPIPYVQPPVAKPLSDAALAMISDALQRNTEAMLELARKLGSSASLPGVMEGRCCVCRGLASANCRQDRPFCAPCSRLWTYYQRRGRKTFEEWAKMHRHKMAIKAARAEARDGK